MKNIPPILAALAAVASAQFGSPDTAALIAGGSVRCQDSSCNPDAGFGPPGSCGDSPSHVQLKSAELFGCPNTDRAVIPDLPSATSYAGGLLWGDLNSVLLCGGVDCVEDFGGGPDSVSVGRGIAQCYLWDPAQDEWKATAELAFPAADQLITFASARATGTGIGRSLDTIVSFGGVDPESGGAAGASEYLDLDLGQWIEYEALPSPALSGAQAVESEDFCVAQVGDLVYEVSSQGVSAVDLATWELSSAAEAPSAEAGWCGLHCRCAAASDGAALYVSSGHVLDLVGMTWGGELAAPAPFAEGHGAPGALVTFRGRPTLFGADSCADIGDCGYSGREVVQLSDDMTEWVSLGFMHEARSSQTVVEVPIEYCNFFALPEGTTVTVATATAEGDGDDGGDVDVDTGSTTASTSEFSDSTSDTTEEEEEDDDDDDGAVSAHAAPLAAATTTAALLFFAI